MICFFLQYDPSRDGTLRDNTLQKSQISSKIHPKSGKIFFSICLKLILNASKWSQSVPRATPRLQSIFFIDIWTHTIHTNLAKKSKFGPQETFWVFWGSQQPKTVDFVQKSKGRGTVLISLYAFNIMEGIRLRTSQSIHRAIFLI